MPDQNFRQDSRRWGQQLQDATERIEEDLKRIVTYINNEVVPDIRRNGSQALRSAAVELQRLAERMDDRRTGGAPPASPITDPHRP